MKISENTSVALPLRNLIAIIGTVAVGVWAYFGVIERVYQKRYVLIVVYSVIVGHSVVGGVLKVLKTLMFATNGEKDFLKDNSVIFMLYG